ncbi:MAG: biotin/lipoyl-binding protein [Bacteroidetes bacterium]|nr:biotin/lipoyl-binding protein [Bacteroidota bacterium]
MYTVSTNNSSYKIEKENDTWKLNGENISIDQIQISETNYHIIKDNKTYDVDVIKFNKEDKTALIKVDGTKYELKIADKFDELLRIWGMDNLAAKKKVNIKAPMPGLVLNILVEDGTVVLKGDALIVLEAMKMENILKSPTDGTVKRFR